jgi:hypothetical protein
VLGSVPAGVVLAVLGCAPEAAATVGCPPAAVAVVAVLSCAPEAVVVAVLGCAAEAAVTVVGCAPEAVVLSVFGCAARDVAASEPALGTSAGGPLGWQALAPRSMTTTTTIRTLRRAGIAIERPF